MIRVIEHWQGSDLGRQRQGNEDNYFVRVPLFVVADGMGGAQAGEVASEMAVTSFEDGLPDGVDRGEALADVIASANRAIHDRSRSDADHAGMGTTCTAAYVADDEVVVAHVGDSRAYLLRDGDLIRLTRDHSLVGELVARGKLTEEQAEAHPQRSVITRALGPEANVQVDVERYPARPGDVYLINSDGLTGMVGEAGVKPILERADTLEQAGRELIAAANEAGGRDNITVVLFRLGEMPAGAAEGDAAAETARAAEDETSEYETWEGEAVPARQGTSRPSAQAHTRVREAEALRADDVRSAVQASDQEEAAYRRDGTVALSAVRPRAAPPPDTQARDAAAAPPARDVPPPARRQRRRRIRPALIVTLALLALVAGAFWAATRLVFFVGTDPGHDNAVAIYQGLPYELPFGLHLYSRYGSPSGVTFAQIPAARRATFTDHKLRSLDDAENLVNALEEGKLEP
jgi:serine/threonine protein phosphatase PrpC